MICSEWSKINIERLLGWVNGFCESETNHEKQGQRPHLSKSIRSAPVETTGCKKRTKGAPENRRVASPRFILLGYLCATRPVLEIPIMMPIYPISSRQTKRLC